MVIISQDTRNLNAVFDNVDGKVILALLRRITTQQLVDASLDLQGDGFGLFSAVDAEAVRLSTVSLLARHLDCMVHPSKVASQPALPPLPDVPSKPDVEEASSTEPPKTWLN